MYLAMARVAFREGYPEIGLYWEKAADEEAEHAAKFAEILGEVVTPSTKKNLEMRVAAENGATAGKYDLAKRAKAANLDAIHDTVHEMAEHSKDFLTDTSVNNPFNISLIKAAPDSGAAFAYHFIEFRVLQSNKKIR